MYAGLLNKSIVKRFLSYSYIRSSQETTRDISRKMFSSFSIQLYSLAYIDKIGGCKKMEYSVLIRECKKQNGQGEK